MVGRRQAVDRLLEAGGDRVALYGVENDLGVPVYVHAKVCVVDDAWASVGSANLNLRSWTHDSEVTAAVADVDFASELRRMLAREHLDSDDDGGLGLDEVFETFGRSAARLQGWYDGHRRGPRPPGRLRPLQVPTLSGTDELWARPVYRMVYDPDGRPPHLTRRRSF